MNITCDHYMSPSGHQLRSCKMCGEALASEVFPDSFGTHNADITWESWNILKCYCRNLHIWHVGIGSQLRRIISCVARLEWDALSVTSWPASFPKIPNHSLWACPTPTHFTQLSVELRGGHGLQVLFPGLNMRPTPSQGRSQWKLIVPPWWCWVLELDPRKRRLGGCMVAARMAICAKIPTAQLSKCLKESSNNSNSSRVSFRQRLPKSENAPLGKFVPPWDWRHFRNLKELFLRPRAGIAGKIRRQEKTGEPVASCCLAECKLWTTPCFPREASQGKLITPLLPSFKKLRRTQGLRGPRQAVIDLQGAGDGTLFVTWREGLRHSTETLLLLECEWLWAFILTYSKLSNSSEMPSQLVFPRIGKVHHPTDVPSPTEFSFASIQAKILPSSEGKVGNFWKIWRTCVMWFHIARNKCSTYQYLQLPSPSFSGPS